MFVYLTNRNKAKISRVVERITRDKNEDAFRKVRNVLFNRLVEMFEEEQLEKIFKKEVSND